MRRYFHSRLYRKMLVSVLLITLIPLGLVYFYINYVYSSRLRQDAVRINHFAEKSAALQAEEILVRMEYLSNLFFIEEVQQILKVSNDPLSINTAQQKLEKVIRVNMDLYNIMNKVDQVSFVRPDGSRFIVMNSAKDTAPLEFNNLERIAVNHYKNHVVMKADELSEQARDKMVYARRIVDMNTLEFMGYCIVIFDKEEFEGIFSDLIQVMNTRVLVSDSSGEVLYSDFDEVHHTSHQMAWDYELDNFGLTLTFYDDISSINSNLRSLRSLTELVILGSVAVILVISVFFVRTIVHPVVCLHESLKNIREGDFHVRVSIEARNELGDVGTAFNDMAAEIDRLVNQVYSIQLKEKETAIAALQAQINPHFLYNTLDMIKSMAEIGGAYQVGEVIVALSGLFRYATSTSSFVVTIRDELENLKHYLLIVNARFDGMITCCVDVPGELLEQKIVKVCLQPLVENVISHGLGRDGKGRRIQVIFRKLGKDIQIRVKDDGIGIPRERLEEVRRSLDGTSGGRLNAKGGNVGLKNIHDRVRLYYGNSYGVTVESEEGIGTQVTILYPAGEPCIAGM